ncbi:signal peptidase I [Trujillonella humicola]|uniref:signal peptidase I n=1 Tax=Trujillonella humicola TaxID=3383699 RepID=UPI003905FFB4
MTIPQVRRRGRHAAPRRRRASSVAVGLVVVLALLTGASLAGLLPLQLMRVDSGSMRPTLSAGDLVLVRHGVDGLRRMDVVAAEHPLTGAPLVKRAVGLPGDTVGLEDGVLVVNGERRCEAGIDPDLLDGVFFGPVTVPDGSVFLLGDARGDSVDSRAFGPVPLDAVLGVVEVRVWPAPGGLPAQGC